MNIKIHFQGFEGFDHHENFVHEIAEKTIAKFERTKAFNASIVIKRHATKHHFTADEYECDIHLQTDGLRGDLFYKKTSPDFYQSVRDTLKAVEKGLRRESRTRMARRRKNIRDLEKHIAHNKEAI